LETPPENLNICTLEEKGILKALAYYLEMTDPNKKMTLCAMPQDLTNKPQTWSDIKAGKCWMINGQHSVEASKRMKNILGAEKKYEKFQEWECFIVWNKDDRVIRKISAYYNRVNHFQNYMPTWATNIISAQKVWVKLKRPPSPKEPTELGRAVSSRNRPPRDPIVQKRWAVSHSHQVDTT
jgi:hypothetical protein